MRARILTLLGLVLFAPQAAADIRELHTPAGASLPVPPDTIVNCSGQAASITVAPEFGTLAAAGAGLVYTPAPGFSGSDSFEYRSSCAGRDAGLASHVILVVVEGKVAPDLVLATGAVTTLAAGQRLILAGTTLLGCAADSNQVTVAADHGSLTLRGSAVVYAPERGFAGIDSFELYRLCGGRRAAELGARFQIVTVEAAGGTPASAPTLVIATGAAVLEQGQAALIARRALVGCDLQGSIVSAAPTGGTATPRGSALVYRPRSGFSGSDAFTYETSCAGKPAGSAGMFAATVKPPKPQYRLSLAVSGAGSGRVVSDPPGLDCTSGNGVCAASYVVGTALTLTASADGGSSFAGWSGGCRDSGNGTSRLVILADTACGARFEPQPVMPEPGWWWNAGEPGSGFAIEAKGTTLRIATLLYRADGAPVWYLAEGAVAGSTFAAPLVEYAGGQSLGGAWRAPEPMPAQGSISIAFASGTAATVTLQGSSASRSLAIQRFPITSAAGTTPIVHALPMPPRPAVRLAAGAAGPLGAGDPAQPRYIVTLARPIAAPSAAASGPANVAGPAMAESQAALGSGVVYVSDVLPWLVLKPSAQGLAALIADPSVVSIKPERWLKPSLAESVPQIGADRVWQVGYRGQGRAVAILDTGVDTAHPFFGGRVVAEACFSTTGAGMVSLCRNGGPFEEGAGAGQPCAPTLDGCLHGTHVAGIAAGAGAAFSGVAPMATIASVKVFAEGDATLCGGSACVLASDADIMMALDWVYRNVDALGIAAVNLSLGGGASVDLCDDEPIKTHIDALRAKGIATVIAAGNDGEPGRVGYPACVSSAIAVGAVTKADRISSYTDRWPRPMLMAPGDGIVSSVPGGGFMSLSGTSMATPHVAGSFALLQSVLGEADVDRILAALTQTGKRIADPLGGGAQIRIDDWAAFTALGVGIHPETGWWWTPDKPGTGLFFEAREGHAYLGLFAYDGGGLDQWYVSLGVMQSASRYDGPLIRCTGGASRDSHAGPPQCASVGRVSLVFDGADTGNLVIGSAETRSLRRYRF